MSARVFLVGALLLGLVSRIAAVEPEQENITAVFKTAENIKLIQTADRVDACLLTFPIPWGVEAKEHLSRDDTPYNEGEYIEVKAAIKERLQVALLEKSTYRWGVQTSCVPMYATRLRFHSGNQTILVDFCLECHVLKVSRNGARTGGGLFDPGKSPYLVVFQELFPAAKFR